MAQNLKTRFAVEPARKQKAVFLESLLQTIPNLLRFTQTQMNYGKIKRRDFLRGGFGFEFGENFSRFINLPV